MVMDYVALQEHAANLSEEVLRLHEEVFEWKQAAGAEAELADEFRADALRNKEKLAAVRQERDDLRKRVKFLEGVLLLNSWMEAETES